MHVTAHLTALDVIKHSVSCHRRATELEYNYRLCSEV